MLLMHVFNFGTLNTLVPGHYILRQLIIFSLSSIYGVAQENEY